MGTRGNEDFRQIEKYRIDDDRVKLPNESDSNEKQTIQKIKKDFHQAKYTQI